MYLRAKLLNIKKLIVFKTQSNICALFHIDINCWLKVRDRKIEQYSNETLIKRDKLPKRFTPEYHESSLVVLSANRWWRYSFEIHLAAIL